MEKQSGDGRESARVEFSVSKSDAGTRADVFLTRALSSRLKESLSRERVKELFSAGLVNQYGRALKPSSKLAAGMLGIIADPEKLASIVAGGTSRLSIEPADLPLDVLHEDDRLVVINKAAGMSVHPAPGDRDPTVAAALMHRWGIAPTDVESGFERMDERNDAPDMDGDEGSGYARVLDPAEALKRALVKARIGIVHRLDKMTSGCLLVARDAAAHAFMGAQFAERTVRKEYLAVTVGVPAQESGTIDAPIARHPRDRMRFLAIARAKSDESLTRAAKDARTDYSVISESHGLALLKLRIHTGRTHQIRVHLKSIGVEIIGDAMYGTGANERFLKFLEGSRGKGTPKDWLELADEKAESGDAAVWSQGILDALGFDGEACRAGQMLHARMLAFTHPDGNRMDFTAPLPAYFESILEVLGLEHQP
ncbi:RluA family pseudouridine synthase [bacterium]|nr:RluA family pseudouridine synthase [bacterium]